MTRLGQVRSGGDRGAYAILYAALVIALLGSASVVIDLAMMREGRATTRSASDAAAAAAAAKLNGADPVESDPLEACRAAWAYLRQGLSSLPNGAASCTGFPTKTVPPTATCVDEGPLTTPTAPKVAAYTSPDDKWTVRITWPVPTNSTLLTNPDTAPANRTQAGDPAFDGTSQCARIAVEVFRTNPAGFAAAFGVGETTIRASSVGRSIPLGDVNEVIAALNILEDDECEALTTSGNGRIDVNGFGDRVGVIAVESSARSSEHICNGSGAAAIHPAPTGNNYIHANGVDGTQGGGIIYSYAMNAPPAGLLAKAITNPGRVDPQPTILSSRSGASPVLNIFDCPTTSTRCADGGGPYITQLDDLYGTAATVPTTVPATGGPWRVLPGDIAVPNFGSCNMNNTNPPIVVPVGNWYINCSTLNTQGILIFRGGTIVSKGSIEAAGNACFAVNVNMTATPPTCPTVVAATSTEPVTTSPGPPGGEDAILYIGGSNTRLFKGSTAQVMMPQTFTYIRDGHTELGGNVSGGSGALLLTTPRALSCAGDLACSYAKFHKLVLWSERDELHSIGGQAGLALRGVLFTPNAQSDLQGQAGSFQTEAQFWTRKLHVGGLGQLIMTADPDASVARPSSGVSLIR